MDHPYGFRRGFFAGPQPLCPLPVMDEVHTGPRNLLEDCNRYRDLVLPQSTRRQEIESFTEFSKGIEAHLAAAYQGRHIDNELNIYNMPTAPDPFASQWDIEFNGQTVTRVTFTEGIRTTETPSYGNENRPIAGRYPVPSADCRFFSPDLDADWDAFMNDATAPATSNSQAAFADEGSVASIADSDDFMEDDDEHPVTWSDSDSVTGFMSSVPRKSRDITTATTANNTPDVANTANFGSTVVAPIADIGGEILTHVVCVPTSHQTRKTALVVGDVVGWDDTIGDPVDITATSSLWIQLNPRKFDGGSSTSSSCITLPEKGIRIPVADKYDSDDDMVYEEMVYDVEIENYSPHDLRQAARDVKNIAINGLDMTEIGQITLSLSPIQIWSLAETTAISSVNPAATRSRILTAAARAVHNLGGNSAVGGETWDISELFDFDTFEDIQLEPPNPHAPDNLASTEMNEATNSTVLAAGLVSDGDWYAFGALSANSIPTGIDKRNLPVLPSFQREDAVVGQGAADAADGIVSQAGMLFTKAHTAPSADLQFINDADINIDPYLLKLDARERPRLGPYPYHHHDLNKPVDDSPFMELVHRGGTTRFAGPARAEFFDLMKMNTARAEARNCERAKLAESHEKAERWLKISMSDRSKILAEGRETNDMEVDTRPSKMRFDEQKVLREVVPLNEIGADSTADSSVTLSQLERVTGKETEKRVHAMRERDRKNRANASMEARPTQKDKVAIFRQRTRDQAPEAGSAQRELLRKRSDLHKQDLKKGEVPGKSLPRQTPARRADNNMLPRKAVDIVGGDGSINKSANLTSGKSSHFHTSTPNARQQQEQTKVPHKDRNHPKIVTYIVLDDSESSETEKSGIKTSKLTSTKSSHPQTSTIGPKLIKAHSQIMARDSHGIEKSGQGGSDASTPQGPDMTMSGSLNESAKKGSISLPHHHATSVNPMHGDIIHQAGSTLVRTDKSAVSAAKSDQNVAAEAVRAQSDPGLGKRIINSAKALDEGLLKPGLIPNNVMLKALLSHSQHMNKLSTNPVVEGTGGAAGKPIGQVVDNFLALFCKPNDPHHAGSGLRHRRLTASQSDLLEDIIKFRQTLAESLAKKAMADRLLQRSFGVSPESIKIKSAELLAALESSGSMKSTAATQPQLTADATTATEAWLTIMVAKATVDIPNASKIMSTEGSWPLIRRVEFAFLSDMQYILIKFVDMLHQNRALTVGQFHAKFPYLLEAKITTKVNVEPQVDKEKPKKKKRVSFKEDVNKNEELDNQKELDSEEGPRKFAKLNTGARMDRSDTA